MAGDVTVGALTRLSHMPAPNLNKDGGNLIAGQNYFNVYFTGGNISNVTLTNCTITLDAINNTPIGATTPSTGAFTNLSFNSQFTYGTPSFSDTGTLEQLTGTVTGYMQSIWQNLSSNTAASTDIVLNNNLGNATTYYANLGINSSAFTGSGSFNLANASYLTATSGDLAIGTTTNNAIHFVINSGATDAMTISTAGNVTMNGTGNSLGTITGGTWNAGVIAGQYGGTGVANTGKTITLGGNLTTSGAFATTLTSTAATNVTLPTSGTLLTTTGSGSSLIFGTGSLSLAGNLTTTGAFNSTFAVTGSNTYTLPNASDTIVTLTASQTLTNKTLTAAALGTSTATTGSFNAGGTNVATQAYVDQYDRVFQRVSTLFTSYASGTNTFSLSNTIPPNTSGDQYMTQTITPKSASSILVIDVLAVMGCSAGSNMIMALFQDSTVNALAAVSQQSGAGANEPVTIPMRYIMTSGTTSSTTFKIRIGNFSASTNYFNGNSAAQIFGGVSGSLMMITEYAA